MTPPEQYDTFRLAKKLLDYQSSMFWPDESGKQISPEHCQTQMTATEAAGTLRSLATSGTTGYYATQEQPACPLPRASSFSYTGFSPTANHTQNAEAIGFDSPAFGNTINRIEHHASFTVNPGTFNGLHFDWQGNYDAPYPASFHMDPNAFASLTPQHAYQAPFETPCQTAHDVDIPINPESFESLMPSVLEQ
ncbi:hypothetical protein ISF_09743 [Cordyceps fumosorosea ARSEF 2679]|uniref:Uncharacterized protein n=1 Tax=Cordyceps fumosorosea (strain ARSEF 2679) TaxID=1081104 RepID=A0A162JBJ5_CORFA|nr:hypothetical protein ISF_09743 [Cordyceps fumosorosea ARSEF 2679]OAA42048.1 hypothetical protein ISF_09743 [Cordyceps fumosorosea ARSEF 2679]